MLTDMTEEQDAQRQSAQERAAAAVRRRQELSQRLENLKRARAQDDERSAIERAAKAREAAAQSAQRAAQAARMHAQAARLHASAGGAPANRETIDESEGRQPTPDPAA
jgi:hypothetical protein